jgi:hypothetical protein
LKNFKFISDQEIDLNQSDFLKTKVYADNLIDIINNTEKDKVFTIGLYGSWGSGKSSIIETTKKKFDQKKERFITYDAWQYSNDSFRRMFLRCLSKELKYTETNFMKRFYENESRDVDNEFKLSYTKSVYVLIGLICVLIILSFCKFEVENKISLFSIITVLGTLTALFSGVFHQLKISVTKPYIFAPEQFEDCFKEIASKALKNNSFIDKIKYINESDFTIKNLEKLIIVIDNIDRCNSDIAYQLLTDIKTFLGSQKFSIIFIIPVDDKALLKHFFSKDPKTSEYSGKEEFLRKIFNVTLRIKPYNSTDMFAFTKSICSHHKINFKNETINIIGKEYSSNPRRVIQLLNNLIVELNNYEELFATENETVICCVLIIREEYPEFYDMVYKNASLLINYNNSQLSKLDEDVQRFMRIAQTEFKETNNGILNKVLMNSNNRFKEIPIEIIDMIDTFNSEDLSKFLNENENVDDEIYNYLCHKIDEAHDNELKNDLSKYLQLVGLINNVKVIPNSYLLRIFEKFDSKLETVFHYAENIDVLMTLVEFEFIHFNKYKIKSKLIEQVEIATNSTDNTYKERWVVIYNSLITILTDDKTSEKIKNDYDRKYPNLVSVDKINDEQFKILVNKKFIENRIKEFDQVDIDNQKYKLIKNILSRFEDKIFVVNSFFERLNSTDISKNGMENRYEFAFLFNDFIEFAGELGLRYNGKSLKRNLEVLFNDVDFYDDNLNLTKVDIFKTFEDDSEKLKFFLTLLNNYYNLTGKLEIIEQYILKLNSYNSQLVREKIVMYLNRGENINFYLKSIIGISNYTDENLVELKKHFLTIPNNDFNESNKELIKRIIEHLLIWIKGEEYKTKINEILGYAINKKTNNDLIFEVINERLVLKEFEVLNNLSSNIMQLYAQNLEINDGTNLLNEPLLRFCFEVDDTILNQKINERLNKYSFSASSLNTLLTLIVPILNTYENKVLTKIIASKLEDKFNSINKNNNTPIMKSLREKINLIKNLK